MGRSRSKAGHECESTWPKSCWAPLNDCPQKTASCMGTGTLSAHLDPQFWRAPDTPSAPPHSYLETHLTKPGPGHSPNLPLPTSGRGGERKKGKAEQTEAATIPKARCCQTQKNTGARSPGQVHIAAYTCVSNSHQYTDPSPEGHG
jgi:hypothetical protein